MVLNGEAVLTDGLSHAELQQIAAQWGAPWYADPSAGNGYPILQWQYDRGDYRELCGFDADNIPTALNDLKDSKDLKDLNLPAFNLAGQRIAKPVQKGIYIVNGRKVLK